jgi:hypothetical protein
MKVKTKVVMNHKLLDSDCYAVLKQRNDHVEIRILSDSEYKGAPIANPTVPPAALGRPAVLASKHNVLVKGYSENTGMPELLSKEGIIGDLVAEHPSGFVVIGEYELGPRAIEEEG